MEPTAILEYYEAYEYCYDRENKNLLVRYSEDGTLEKYVYGNGLIASSETKEAQNPKYKTYLYDLRGSVTFTLDSSANITSEYRYSTYGNRNVIKGSTTSELGYCARDGVLTEVTGLLYMRARYYMPDLMRFINQDIVTGDISNSNSLNRYTYVEGNPATMIDPFGLCAEKYDKSDLDAWGADNFQLYLSVLGFYNGKNDYNLFSAETQKALSNFNKVYGLSDDQKLRNILNKIVAAYTTYNKVISSDNLKELTETKVNGKLEFKYDDIQKSNFAKIWAFMEEGYNLDKTKISGALGCINQESRASADNAWDPSFPGPHNPDYISSSTDRIAYGIIQWYYPSRKKGLEDKASENDMDLTVSDINVQLAFLRYEIDSKDNSWMNGISCSDVALSFNDSVIQGGSKQDKQDMAEAIYRAFLNY